MHLNILLVYTIHVAKMRDKNKPHVGKCFIGIANLRDKNKLHDLYVCRFIAKVTKWLSHLQSASL